MNHMMLSMFVNRPPILYLDAYSTCKYHLLSICAVARLSDAARIEFDLESAVGESYSGESICKCRIDRGKSNQNATTHIYIF